MKNKMKNAVSSIFIILIIVSCSSNIPKDIEYSVVSYGELTKVNINKRTDINVLMEIADEVKKDKCRDVFFYVNGENIERGGCWASVTYHPSKSAHINGISDSQESNMLNPKLPEGEIIGKWVDNTTYSERTMIFFKRNDSLKLREVYKDGGYNDIKLVKKKDRYLYDGSVDQQFTIEKNGNLSVYGAKEKYYECKPL
jgi:hypothetical protein